VKLTWRDSRLLTFKEAVTVDNRHKKKEVKKKRSGQVP